jgi:hypothetical protein
MVKDKLNEIYALGSKISDLRNQLVTMKARAVKVSHELAKTIDTNLAKTQDMYSTWQKVKGYIDQWKGKWIQASTEATEEHPISSGYQTSVSGLAVLPVVLLGAAGISALAYVSVQGLKLIKDYAYQRSVVKDLEANLLSVEQAKGLIAVTATPTFGTEFAKYAGLALVALIGVYFILPKFVKG